MRITGGTMRGRVLAVPQGRDIRPTADKVRQAVFNMLVPYGLPRDAQVLDAFCGTGAFGLDALSRGATFCTFRDSARPALDCARRNAQALGVEVRCRFLAGDSTRPGAKPSAAIPATLAFLDPPYRQNLVLPALEQAARHGWLAPGAVCVIEAEKDAAIYVPETFGLVKRKLYGRTQIVLCRYGASAPP